MGGALHPGDLQDLTSPPVSRLMVQRLSENDTGPQSSVLPPSPLQKFPCVLTLTRSPAALGWWGW